MFDYVRMPTHTIFHASVWKFISTDICNRLTLTDVERHLDVIISSSIHRQTWGRENKSLSSSYHQIWISLEMANKLISKNCCETAQQREHVKTFFAVRWVKVNFYMQKFPHKIASRFSWIEFWVLLRVLRENLEFFDETFCSRNSMKTKDLNFNENCSDFINCLMLLSFKWKLLTLNKKFLSSIL